MDILRALDASDLTLLTLLDLSAAFHTVDHATLLRRLEVSYGIRSSSLGWFSSYLCSRFQYVRCGLSKSTLRLVLCGVPQGSVLGPILFLLYTADIIRLIESHCLNPHVYADDTQIYGFCRSLISCKNRSQRVLTMWRCGCEAIGCSLTLLNTAKTEVLRCVSSRRQHQIPQVPVRIRDDLVLLATSVRDFGIHLALTPP